MRLDKFSSAGFDRGPFWREAAWMVTQWLFVSSSWPGSAHRAFLLRLFGAHVGKGVTIKPRVRVKFPWRLRIGDWVWVGEGVWVDNLADVTIGSHSVVSQGVYLCTGSHDWKRDTFDLIVRPIAIGNSAWIAAMSVLAPGTVVEDNAVVAMGSVVSGTVRAGTIVRGNPATFLRERTQGSASFG